MAFKPKYFVGVIFVLLGAFILYHTVSTPVVSCDGWDIINPICWAASSWGYVTDFIGWIVGIGLIIFGAMVFVITEENAKWFIMSMILGVIAVVMIILSPGIPFDELALGIGSVGSALMGFTKGNDSKAMDVF